MMVAHVIEQIHFKTQKILVLFFNFLTSASEVPVNMTISFIIDTKESILFANGH